jgi:hypothetical protein
MAIVEAIVEAMHIAEVAIGAHNGFKAGTSENPHEAFEDLAREELDRAADKTIPGISILGQAIGDLMGWNAKPEEKPGVCLPTDGWHPPMVRPDDGGQSRPEDAKCPGGAGEGLFTNYAD